MSPLRAKPIDPIPRARPRRWPFGLEALEDRVTPTLTPRMVLDINQTTLSSNPSEMVVIGSTTYFTADDGIHGVELWKSDGTAAGTVLVKDICPGGGSSIGAFGPADMTNVNGTLMFAANDGTHGQELWKSDGTAAGTVLVKDIFPGGASSEIRLLTNVNGTLFFSANDGVHSVELWKSDGTAAGTALVKDIRPGSSANPGNPTDVNGTLFFTANDGPHGEELWRSDGTAAGTVLVKDINPGLGVSASYWYSSNPYSLTSFDGTLFFSAYDRTHGRELWKSDGTAAGTVLVKDIFPGLQDSSPSVFPNVNGTLFFLANDGIHGRELWKSDGTAAGTVLVKEICPDDFAPSNLTDVNGTLFFTANYVPHGVELWKSDGTAAGTVLVKDIYPGIRSSYPGDLTNVNGTLFFTAYDDTHGTELWQSDGTVAGTVLVKDIYPFGNSNGVSFGSDPSTLTNVDGTLFFSADDGTHGNSLWKSDGTAAGTVLVSTECSSPDNLINANGTLFLSAFDRNGRELWRSDGTAAGTVLVKDINSKITANGSDPSIGLDVNGTLFFIADDGVHGRELWRTDGTAAGTTLVKDIYPGTHREYDYYGNWWDSGNSSNPSSLTNVNGTLFFTTYDTTHGYVLWKSDGTAAGTVLVSLECSSLGNLTNVNGTLYFAAWDNTHGAELWKSDGTAAGTTLVKDIYPGSHIEYYYGYFGGRYSRVVISSSAPNNLTILNGTLFFTAEDTNGRELWRSDGTAAGTVRVKDIYPGNSGSISSYTNSLTNVNGTLFFVANDGSTGSELWRSDGTAAGTNLVTDIYPGTPDSFPSALTNVNGTLFFQANDGSHGYELWRSDGTAAGTMLVKDIRPGSFSSFSVPGDLTNVDGTLFFKADNDATGRELWKSDGTAAGTVLVKDIDPGTGGSYPYGLTNVNGKLFFTVAYGQGLWESDGTTAGTVPVVELHAISLMNFNDTLFFAGDDGIHGRELWTLVDDAPTVAGVTVNAGAAQRSMVTTLTVTFSTLVTIAPGAFTLTRVGRPNGAPGDGATVGTITVTTQTVNGVTVATLTFGGANVTAGSLADGTWTLTIDRTKVTSAAGSAPMAADFSRAGIKRLLGDADGDGDVDNADFFQFRSAFGTTAGRSGFLAAFDFDGDGDIDNADFFQFRSRFGWTV